MPASTFRREPVSFVQRDSRLTPSSQAAWDAPPDRLVLDVPRGEASTSVAAGYRLDPVAVFGRRAPLVLEIGSGSGDAVVARGGAAPRTGLPRGRGLPPRRRPDAVAARRCRRDQRAARAGQRGRRAAHRPRRRRAAGGLDLLPRPVAEGQAPQAAAGDPRDRRPGRRAGWRPAGAGAWPPTGPTTPSRCCRPGRRARLLSNPYGGLAPRYDGRPVTRFERKGVAVGRPIADLTFERVG